MDAVRVLRTGTVFPAHFQAAGLSCGCKDRPEPVRLMGCTNPFVAAVSALRKQAGFSLPISLHGSGGSFAREPAATGRLGDRREP